MQSLYAFHSLPDQTLNLAEKELFFSINKTYDLYHLLLQLIVEMHNYAENRIELKKQRHIPTKEDLNPNTKFITNELVLKIVSNASLKSYIDKNKLSWVENPEIIKKLYTQLIESPEYGSYMISSDRSYSEDRKLVEFFFNNILAQSEDLYQLLEEKSIYWNDDVEFVISMILKTIQKFKPSSTESKTLLPLFKDDDDLDFTKKLFRKAVLESKEHREMIKNHLRNWDLDRVAFIDVLIMEMALVEFIYFPSIPTKVSLNEYIDLAKYYSTSKSKTFINGILDKILKSLKDEGKINKVGRGLVGEDEN
jgi:N utilization substance protein B